ncbi:hypothetical protein TNIN_162241 [Trichonephila inaurata madagascariensis]|uniref:Uncharacterized protein n=1 Tax=Trichonephila inaurata madagascariensis TaxID=2747483 RepID=A0A8X6XW84_9ARAC|nr:hypothetical protein TNIN_162241 [Trichonephila inaurata madagascariensis]
MSKTKPRRCFEASTSVQRASVALEMPCLIFHHVLLISFVIHTNCHCYIGYCNKLLMQNTILHCSFLLNWKSMQIDQGKSFEMSRYIFDCASSSRRIFSAGAGGEFAQMLHLGSAESILYRTSFIRFPEDGRMVLI